MIYEPAAASEPCLNACKKSKMISWIDAAHAAHAAHCSFAESSIRACKTPVITDDEAESGAKLKLIKSRAAVRGSTHRSAFVLLT